MPRPVNAVPVYLQHKASGQAYIRVTTGGTRRVIYLGKYDTPESRAEYRRVIAELEVAGPAAVATRPTCHPLNAYSPSTKSPVQSLARAVRSASTP